MSQAIYEAYIGAIEILKKEGSKIPKLFWAIPDAAVPAEIKEKVRDVQAYDTLFASQKEVGDFGGVDLKSGDYNDCAVLCYSSGTVSLLDAFVSTLVLNIELRIRRVWPKVKSGMSSADETDFHPLCLHRCYDHTREP